MLTRIWCIIFTGSVLRTMAGHMAATCVLWACVVGVAVGEGGAMYQNMGGGRCGEPYQTLNTLSNLICALHCSKSKSMFGS